MTEKRMSDRIADRLTRSGLYGKVVAAPDPSGKEFYAATLKEKNGQVYHFVSLDGELYLGCEGDPNIHIYEEVEEAFSTDGKTTMPMRMTKEFLRRQEGHRDTESVTFYRTKGRA